MVNSIEERAARVAVRMQEFGAGAGTMRVSGGNDTATHKPSGRMLGVRDAAGNPAFPTIPPLPNTTPPRHPSTPENPPPLPDDEEEDENDNWDEAEVEIESPEEVEEKPDPLERQRLEDAQRFGGKDAAKIMMNARQHAKRVRTGEEEVPPFPFDNMVEIANEKGLDGEKIAKQARQNFNDWLAYSKIIKAKIVSGQEVSSMESTVLRTMGIEACRLPAQIIGIDPALLNEMMADIDNVKPETKEEEKPVELEATLHRVEASEPLSPADEEAKFKAMTDMSLNIVNSLMKETSNDALAVQSILVGATGMHLLGFTNTKYRDQLVRDMPGQLHSFFDQNEHLTKQLQELEAKNNAEANKAE
jgi:hypothetical protein